MIQFLYGPTEGPSVYWLEGVLEKRIDKYEIAKESEWKKNLFVVNQIKVIKYWGCLEPLPGILIVNLSKDKAWALVKRLGSHHTKER